MPTPMTNAAIVTMTPMSGAGTFVRLTKTDARRLVKASAGSIYLMFRVAKKSVSLVNAAFITSGAPATIGQDAVSMTLLSPGGTWVMCEEARARHRVVLVRLPAWSELRRVAYEVPSDGLDGSRDYLWPSSLRPLFEIDALRRLPDEFNHSGRRANRWGGAFRCG